MEMLEIERLEKCPICRKYTMVILVCGPHLYSYSHKDGETKICDDCAFMEAIAEICGNIEQAKIAFPDLICESELIENKIQKGQDNVLFFRAGYSEQVYR